jgi:hypothetical protein
MKLSIKMALPTLALAMAAIGTPASAQVNVVLDKFPTSYTSAGKTFVNLEGYVINIADYRYLNFANTDMKEMTVRCDFIHPSTVNLNGGNLRTKCNNGTPYKCRDLYTNTAYKKDDYTSNRMVPSMPVSFWVTKKKLAEPSMDFVGFNAGFFNTNPLPGRDTSESFWIATYQETCGYTHGSFKRDNTGISDSYSRFGDVEITNGVPEKPLGALRFRKISNQWNLTVLTGNQDSGTQFGDVVVPGVWVRNGTDVLKTNGDVPDWVEAKWDSAVARTILGYNPDTQDMRIVVVQGGRNGVGSGLTVDDARKLVGSQAAYPQVLLLDGSGSTQLASTKASTLNGSQSNKRRTDCLWSAQIKECSLRGDSVSTSFVSHWDAGFRSVKDPNNFTKTLVDRPVPAVLVLRY